MMLRRGLACGLAVLIVAACGGGGSSEAPVAESETGTAPAEIRIENVGFATPESVLFDAAADVYLVSNVNGSPLSTDGNGFISRVAPDGEVLDLAWIDGTEQSVELNAPKGMAIVGDTLYVADLTVVRLFDRLTGEPLGAVELPGATFVNDLAPTRDGLVIASDSGMTFTEKGLEATGSAAVYLINQSGGLIEVAAGDILEFPNGVLDSTAHDGIAIAPYGGNTVFLLDEDGERIDIVELPTGGLDGLMETSDGRLLVSSWDGSAVYVVTPDGQISIAARGLPAPADIGWDGGRGRLLVPLFNDDSVVILPME